MIGASHDLPGIAVVVDVASPGQRLDSRRASRALRRARPARGNIRRAIDATERDRRDVAADQQQIGRQFLHQVELAFGAREMRARCGSGMPSKSRNGWNRRSQDRDPGSSWPTSRGLPPNDEQVVLENLDASNPAAAMARSFSSSVPLSFEAVAIRCVFVRQFRHGAAGVVRCGGWFGARGAVWMKPVWPSSAPMPSSRRSPAPSAAFCSIIKIDTATVAEISMLKVCCTISGESPIDGSSIGLSPLMVADLQHSQRSRGPCVSILMIKQNRAQHWRFPTRHRARTRPDPAHRHRTARAERSSYRTTLLGSAMTETAGENALDCHGFAKQRAGRLRAIAAAGFGAVEIFENDLLSFSGGPRNIGQMCRISDFDLRVSAVPRLRRQPEPQRARNFARAERKFDLMQELRDRFDC